MQRRRIAVVVLILALIGLCVGMRHAIVRWAVAKTVFVRSPEIGTGNAVLASGTVLRSVFFRWRGEEYCTGLQECWYTSTGYLRDTWDPLTDRVTSWDIDGKVVRQIRGMDKLAPPRESPPWLWGVTDQTTPNAPWFLAGMTFEEWWDSLPEAEKREQ